MGVSKNFLNSYLSQNLTICHDSCLYRFHLTRSIRSLKKPNVEEGEAKRKRPSLKVREKKKKVILKRKKIIIRDRDKREEEIKGEEKK